MTDTPTIDELKQMNKDPLLAAALAMRDAVVGLARERDQLAERAHRLTQEREQLGEALNAAESDEPATPAKAGPPDGPRLPQPPDVPLTDVLWRVDSQAYRKPDGTFRARFVPYLSAPIVAAMFDRWVGPGFWWDDYEWKLNPDSKPVIECAITVRLPDGREVTRRDVGVPPGGGGGASGRDMGLREKGGISDAFKRAATLKWGVGRNVYELPNLYAPCDGRPHPKKSNEFIAYPNKDSQPDLVRQLKQLGYSADAAHAVEEDAIDHRTEGEAPEVDPTAPFEQETWPDPVIRYIDEWGRPLAALKAWVLKELAEGDTTMASALWTKAAEKVDLDPRTLDAEAPKVIAMHKALAEGGDE